MSDLLPILQYTLAVSDDCRRCPLHRERTKVVPGEGDPNARLLILGEAPGRSEDATGKPFVGAAGELRSDEFTFGDALTVHKSQGSPDEYDSQTVTIRVNPLFFEGRESELSERARRLARTVQALAKPSLARRARGFRRLKNSMSAKSSPTPWACRTAPKPAQRRRRRRHGCCIWSMSSMQWTTTWRRRHKATQLH